MPPVKKEREEKKPYSRPDKVRPFASSARLPSEAHDLTPQPARKEWTEEEEVVWREILEKTIRKHLPQAVREDGRLESRKNSIKSHMNALVSSIRPFDELTSDREHEEERYSLGLITRHL